MTAANSNRERQQVEDERDFSQKGGSRTLFQSFLTGIADAGRELLEIRNRKKRKNESIRTLCEDLLTQRGEALGTALAREVAVAYARLMNDEKLHFFETLATDFDVAHEAMRRAIDAYLNDPNSRTAQALSAACEARRQKVIRAINMAPSGTSAVIRMREDLMGYLEEHPHLGPVDADFLHLLSSWFNRGFLVLQRIDWRTPAKVLEKLIQYEAVHAIRGWNDLRRRLDMDRRCYAFFHPALPDEPLIFVEVALVKGLASSIQELLDDVKDPEVPDEADTAIFYSINNCRAGLRGISFGNFLIKQVVYDLHTELPSLKTFSTLSPIPGFASWLERSVEQGELPAPFAECGTVLSCLRQEGWHSDEKLAAQLKKPLLGLCAHYLLNEKLDDRPVDPVAQFHLGNGARLERINWLGDVSSKGLKESAGLMVNYLYDLKRIERYHESYMNSGKIVYSSSVKSLMG